MREKHITHVALPLLVTILLVLMTIGCSNDKHGEQLTTPREMIIEVEDRKVNNMYVAKVIDPDSEEVLYISSLGDFDSIYREGNSYIIKVKEIKSIKTGLSTYTFIEILDIDS